MTNDEFIDELIRRLVAAERAGNAADPSDESNMGDERIAREFGLPDSSDLHAIDRFITANVLMNANNPTGLFFRGVQAGRMIERIVRSTNPNPDSDPASRIPEVHRTYSAAAQGV